ncbi:MAG: SsrA-binding protein, partial [Alphaproteobacteria bacterium]
MRTLIKSGQVAVNRKARFEYSIDDTIEAGISLTGAEVKSIRFGMVNITDGFVSMDKDGNLVLKNIVVQPLPTA